MKRFPKEIYFGLIDSKGLYSIFPSKMKLFKNKSSFVYSNSPDIFNKDFMSVSVEDTGKQLNGLDFIVYTHKDEKKVQIWIDAVRGAITMIKKIISYGSYE